MESHEELQGHEKCLLVFGGDVEKVHESIDEDPPLGKFENSSQLEEPQRLDSAHEAKASLIFVASLFLGTVCKCHHLKEGDGERGDAVKDKIPSEIMPRHLPPIVYIKAHLNVANVEIHDDDTDNATTTKQYYYY